MRERATISTISVDGDALARLNARSDTMPGWRQSRAFEGDLRASDASPVGLSYVAFAERLVGH